MHLWSSFMNAVTFETKTVASAIGVKIALGDVPLSRVHCEKYVLACPEDSTFGSILSWGQNSEHWMRKGTLFHVDFLDSCPNFFFQLNLKVKCYLLFTCTYMEIDLL